MKRNFKRFALFLIIAYVLYSFPGIDLSVFLIKQKNSLDRIELYDGIMINPICPNFSAEITTKDGENIILKDLNYFFGQLRFGKFGRDYSKGGILLEFEDISFDFHIKSADGKTKFIQGIPISILSVILQEKILTVNDFFKNYEKIETMLLSLPTEKEASFEIYSEGRKRAFFIRRTDKFL